MKWKSYWKKLENFGNKNVFGIKYIKVWMIVAILFVIALNQNQMYSIVGSSFEGPDQEAVAIGFDSQPCIYQGSVKHLDGIYYHSSQLSYASKWDWGNPSSIHIDPDAATAGIPDLYFTDDAYGSCNRDLENSEDPISKVEYTVEHDGENWGVIAYQYYFKTYVRLSAIADDSLNLPGANEVGYNVKADVYFRIGINRWSVQEYNNEMWAGILKLEVYEITDDGDTESRTYYAPSGNAALDLSDSVAGHTAGQYSFDDFDDGWQNPDNIPDEGYYKLSLDFTAGRTISNKLKQPWVRFTIVAKVLVTHRWILTDQIGDPVDPIINDDQYEIEENLWNIINELIAGVDVLMNLVKLLILIIVGFVAIIVIMMILAGLMRLGGKRR